MMLLNDFLICVAALGANITCSVNEAIAPCFNPVCLGDLVTINSTTIPSNDNYWKLPSGSCPGDSIQLPQGMWQGCGGMSMICGPFKALNFGPDSSSGKCLTSALTFGVNTTAFIRCGSSDINGSVSDTTNITIMTIGNILLTCVTV